MAAEQLGVPADGAGLQRLPLGVGDGGHDALERAIGGQRHIFAFDRGKGRREQEPGHHPAQQRPERKVKPVQVCVGEPELHAQGEECDRPRPNPQRRPIHGEREQGGKEDEGEDELSHRAPPNTFRPLPVPPSVKDKTWPIMAEFFVLGAGFRPLWSGWAIGTSSLSPGIEDAISRIVCGASIFLGEVVPVD